MSKLLNWLAIDKRGARPAPLLFLLILVAAVLPGTMANAQSGIAMVGTFYAQVFEIPPGAEVSAPSIYVVVFNHGEDESRFEMSGESPLGVEIVISEGQFTLPPGGQKKVFITVRVGEDAVPGQYELIVRATQVMDEVEGAVVVSTAAAQQADLIIVGESAMVEVQVVSPNGEPVVSVVRLFKIIEGKEMEFASSETGVLEAKVSPGSYTTSAYVAGQQLAEESFDVMAGETKMIVLSGRTAYIGGFGVVPNYSTETGKLVFVEIVYTINNFYQPMADIEVILQVSLDSEFLEDISLVTFESLNTGRTGGSYNYIPSKGWESGEYSFELELYKQGELYTKTLEEKQRVESKSSILEYTDPIIVFLLCLGILVILVMALLIWRRKLRRHAL